MVVYIALFPAQKIAAPQDLIAQNMVSFLGTGCHNVHHAALYEKWQTKKAWHDLHNSGKLLNSTL